MKTFSSIITLLLTSTASADVVTSIMARPHIAQFMMDIQEGSSVQMHCQESGNALMTCVGQGCIDCITNIFDDLAQGSKCADLEDGSFCDDMKACEDGDCAVNDCDAEAEALEACMEEMYEDKEDPCPGLCPDLGTTSEDFEAHSVHEASVTAADVMARPHVAKLLFNVQAGDAEEDMPCQSEAKTLMDCVGNGCIECIVNIFNDLAADTTCASLEAGPFCDDLDACEDGICAVNDCDAAGDALDQCIETEEFDEPCPGLCVDGATTRGSMAFAMA